MLKSWPQSSLPCSTTLSTSTADIYSITTRAKRISQNSREQTYQLLIPSQALFLGLILRSMWARRSIGPSLDLSICGQPVCGSTQQYTRCTEVSTGHMIATMTGKHVDGLVSQMEQVACLSIRKKMVNGNLKNNIQILLTS